MAEIANKRQEENDKAKKSADDELA